MTTKVEVQVQHNDLYDMVKVLEGEGMKERKDKAAWLYFIKNHLNNWLKFAKKSDDILYPQNKVFIKIGEVLKSIFPEAVEM